MIRGVQAGLAAALGAAALAAAAQGQEWPQFAGGPSRVSAAPGPPPSLASPRWVLGEQPGVGPITFASQGGAVAAAGRVLAVGRVGTPSVHKLFCADAATGGLIWAAPVPAPVLDSWSTPAVDVQNGVVIVASGSFLTAVDLVNGALRWQTPLSRPVVNASPLVTGHLGGGAADRVFITDYDGFGGSGRLYCINIDPFAPGTNPHQPGEIVWTVVLGTTSGNTPACLDDVVYVASVADESGAGPGRIMAFDAAAATPPPPLWVFTNTQETGFFGGVALLESPGGPRLYAASYSLTGGHLSANLVKLDAGSGVLAWSVPCNRTDATPVPLPGGRVVVSGGIRGFGSMPSLSLFRDDGGSAMRLWDTALDTWVDANLNGQMEPGECMVVGGWSHQPVLMGSALLVGAIPVASSFGPCTDLYTLDPASVPGQPGFILDHAAGTGSTPAAAGGAVYTIGAGGLHAFGPACYANCDGSTGFPVLNINDFVCYLNRYSAGDPWANCDASTSPPVLNVNDFICFSNRFAGGCM